MVAGVSEQSVHRVIAEALGVHLAEVHDGLFYQSIPQWSSLNHVNLMVRLSEEYGIGKDGQDARKLVDVRSIKRRLGIEDKERGLAQEKAQVEAHSESSRVDRGLTNTVLDTTEITKIGSGSSGPLYRGYQSLELSRENSFEEVASLLVAGQLHPLYGDARALVASGQSAAREVLRRRQSELPDKTGEFVTMLLSVDVSFARVGETNPIEALRREGWALLGAASVFATQNEQQTSLTSTRPLTGSIVAGVQPRVPLDEAVNILSRVMVLQADNGASASTLAVRVAMSAGSPLQHAVCAAALAFGGALHGGAIRSIVDFLDHVPVEDMRRVVEEKLEAGVAVPGFGHRVYGAGDPRAEPMRTDLEALSERIGDGRYADQIRILREVMHQREQFGAAANYDLYAGPSWRLLGFDTHQLVPIFTVARMAGWIAHSVEQLQANTLIRPQLEYIGAESPAN